jgi:predicted transcriptional regulator
LTPNGLPAPSTRYYILVNGPHLPSQIRPTRQGIAIREARLAAGLTQRALGERIGMHWTNVAHYELGTFVPSPRQLARILEGCK